MFAVKAWLLLVGEKGQDCGRFDSGGAHGWVAYPHPEAPPGFDQVATFLHVTAVGVLVVGVTVALIAGLVARRRTCSRATSFMMAVGVAGAVVGGIGVIAMSLLS